MLGVNSKSGLLRELKESESDFHDELPQILEMGDFKCNITLWFCRSKEMETAGSTQFYPFFLCSFHNDNGLSATCTLKGVSPKLIEVTVQSSYLGKVCMRMVIH